MSLTPIIYRKFLWWHYYINKDQNGWYMLTLAHIYRLNLKHFVKYHVLKRSK